MRQTLSFIVNHPLNQNQKFKSVFRFVTWQVYARLFNPTYIHQFTPKVKLMVRKGMTGASGNLYCGLHEFNDMGFLLHFLRSEDTFMDIGANVGSYTLLASGHVGANTLAFEPVLETFRSLEGNVNLNHLKDRVIAYNYALGAEEGRLKFTNDQDTMNHIAIEQDQNVFEVEVKAVDALLNEQNIPSLMKIDVEGFETEVIKGSVKTLAKSNLKAIIIELNGSGKRYGYDEQWIHTTLSKNGFQPYFYEPFERKLIPSNNNGKVNTIYIRDLEFVLQRLTEAAEIKIGSNQF